jgi:hypothetical protein
MNVNATECFIYIQLHPEQVVEIYYNLCQNWYANTIQNLIGTLGSSLGIATGLFSGS